MLSDLVPIRVEDLRPGDEIELPVLGLHVVSEISWLNDRHGVLTASVVYFRHTESVMTSSGFAEIHRLVERTLKPLLAGTVLNGRKGTPERADRLRRRMIFDLAARAQSTEGRLATYRDKREREAA